MLSPSIPLVKIGRNEIWEGRMRYPTNPELWQVTAWLARREPHGFEFSLWVSPKFLEASARADFDKGKLQQLAREMLVQAGEQTLPSQEPLTFGQWGLEAINLAGDGKWFYMEHHPDDVLRERGGLWSSHNIDHAIEQSVLFAIWGEWAKFIEAEVRHSGE